MPAAYTRGPIATEHHITRLLVAARAGHSDAFDKLMPLVYDELRRVAHQRLLGYRPGDTLNTTALVHEAYLKLIRQQDVSWEDRAHFFALASRAMRFILVDYARARTAEKRGGRQADLPLDILQIAAEERTAELLALNEALERLAESSERLSLLVEYRFFGGLTYEEIVEVTGWSLRTVKRDWRRARAWLLHEMEESS